MVDSDVAIYLHWNGGRDTVEPVLEVAKEYGLTGDDTGMNDLYKMFHNMIASDMAETVYIGTVPEYNGSASGDNGTYIIDKDFNIIDRLDFERKEQQVYPFKEIYDWTRKENDKHFMDNEPDIYIGECKNCKGSVSTGDALVRQTWTTVALDWINTEDNWKYCGVDSPKNDARLATCEPYLETKELLHNKCYEELYPEDTFEDE